MTTARDIMHAGAESISADENLAAAARKMRDMDVGALPVLGPDSRIQGIITDRDIVVKCVAAGREPQKTKVSDLSQGDAVTVEADAGVDEILKRMVEHGIRRLPVTEKQRVIGMISEADLARNLPDNKVGEFVEAITALRG
jgi:CBS domain-containing protein